jgi:hypothetical protein
MVRRLVPLLLAAACAGQAGSGLSDDQVLGTVDGTTTSTWPEGDRTTVTATIDATAHGFALGDGRATTGMLGMTCGVHLDTGSVFFDLDLQPGRVQDGTDDRELTLTSLLVAAPLVHMVPVENPFASQAFLVHGVQQARILDRDGFVALRRTEGDRCEVRTYDDGHLVDSVLLPPEVACDGNLHLALADGAHHLYVAGPSGVWSLLDGEPAPVGVAGDVLAWDATEGLLYVGERGGEQLVALDAEGEAWTLELDGPLVDLDDGGERGGVVVAVEAGFGADVIRLDATGAEVDRLLFDRPVLDLAVSPLGDRLAVGRSDDHAYYRLD